MGLGNLPVGPQAITLLSSGDQSYRLKARKQASAGSAIHFHIKPFSAHGILYNALDPEHCQLRTCAHVLNAAQRQHAAAGIFGSAFAMKAM